VGESSDNFHISLSLNPKLRNFVFVFSSNSFFVCPAIPNIIFAYPQGFTYHRLGSTGLDNRLTDGGYVVSLTLQRFTKKNLRALISVRGWVNPRA
jgi:hypothetical protein